MQRVRPQRLAAWPGDSHKLLLGMIHLQGGSESAVLDIARQECEAYLEGGMDGVVVENYFGTVDDVRRALPLLKAEFPGLMVGVDVIWQNDLSFDLALEHELPFIQLDSAAGHLHHEDEGAFEERVASFRARTDALILGGVRLKNQPYLSGNDLATDLRIAKGRTDAVIVTGTRTGEETSLTKIEEFRSHLGDFPLVVGAGVNLANCIEQLSTADGAIIGTGLKRNGKTEDVVDAARVRALVSAVREIPMEEKVKI